MKQVLVYLKLMVAIDLSTPIANIFTKKTSIKNSQIKLNLLCHLVLVTFADESTYDIDSAWAGMCWVFRSRCCNRIGA